MRARFLLAAVVLLGCGPDDCEVCGEELVTGAARIRGLWTDPNDLDAPEGALAVADNIVLNRDGVAEPRRGTEHVSYTALSGAVNAMYEYADTLVVHHSTASISRWSGSAWVAYSGTFTPVDASTKVRFWEDAGSLFALCQDGVYQLDSATGTWRLTGSPPALQGAATLRRTSNETGAVTANSQRAYRLVWAFNDAKFKLQLGEVSGRFLVTNPALVTALAANINKAGSAVVTVTNTTHGFVTGEYVDVTITGDANFTSGRFQVTRISDTSFTYNDGGLTPTAASTVNSTNGFTSRNVDIAAPIPSGVTTSHVLQVYGSALSADANSEPSDSMGLLFERAPTAVEITAKTMTVTEIVPDALRGTALYTSLTSLAESKKRPPVAHDAAVWQGASFFADTAGLQTIEFQLLAVGGSNGLAIGDIFVPCLVDTATGLLTGTSSLIAIVGAAAETLGSGEFKVFSAGSAAQNIADTAKSIVRVINAATSWGTGPDISAAYVSAESEAPGRIRIYAKAPTTAAFTFLAHKASGTVPTGLFFAPSLPVVNNATMVRTSNVVVVTTAAAQTFVVGQTVLVTVTGAGYTSGLKTITVVTDTTHFEYAETAANGSGAGFVVNQSPLTVLTKNGAATNGLMWSQQGEPWAVPAVNFKRVGKDSSTLLRIIPTRDRLLLLTDAGFYQLTGAGGAWFVSEYDTTLNLAGRELAASADAVGYAMTQVGAVVMSDAARPISGPIQKSLREILVGLPSLVAGYGFAVSYPSDHKVIFFMPDGANDTWSPRAWVYHSESGDWTRWDYDHGDGGHAIRQRCAIVAASVDKLYFGGQDGDVVKERKTLSGVADQVDSVLVGGDYKTLTATDGATYITLSGWVDEFGIIGATLRNVTDGTTATITSYDATTNRIGLSSYTGWGVNDHVNITAQPILTILEPVAQAAGSPGEQKLWSGGSLAFRDSQFSAAELTFRSDLSPTIGGFSAATTIAPPGGSGAEPTEIDFWVPRSYQRATRLQLHMEHNQALERFALQSFDLKARICTSRTSQ